MSRFNKAVGIGGIGAGMLFLTSNNASLGRSESRLVELSDAKDYCKQHIVFHYIAALLCPDVKVYPVGYVGNDAHGAALLDEMRKVGMDVSWVKTHESLPTMISICLQYPDKETCNFTASNSACDEVTPKYTIDSMDAIGIDAGTIVAALPEVQFESRIQMLKSGKEKGAFCCLSILESEADDFKKADIWHCCDLLALNLGEAHALAPEESSDSKKLISGLYEYLRKCNPDIMLIVTCGKDGAFTSYKGHVEFVPTMTVDAINTTGAGDAFLGGLISGLAMNMPLQKGCSDNRFGETPLQSAAELGAICAGMAVETVDTIAKKVSQSSVLERVTRHNFTRGAGFLS
ncbi:MAG: carbohydrate kinase family protein [Defluviitaleaceae bacterium]|nr:carbohydrate kinase family protein [Defluviitaleaceae bacterium]